MKKPFLPSAIAAAMFATCLAWVCFASPASAQAPLGRAVQGQSGIALIDMTYILRNHVRLKSQMNELKTRVDKAQADFQKEGQRLQGQAQELSTLKPGSPAYSQQEETLLNANAALKNRAALMNKEFEQEEAKLLYGAYCEISQEVENFAKSQGIVLVLNFSKDKVRDEIPPSNVRFYISRQVVYSQGLDITDIIKRRFVQPETASRPVGPMGVGGPGGTYPPPSTPIQR